MKELAQNPTGLGTIGGTGLGPFSGAMTQNQAIVNITKVVSSIIGLLTLVAGIYLLFQLITAAFNWMSASGDKSKLEKARLQMTQSLTGLIIVVAAYAIVSVIGTVLGVDLLLQNPTTIPNILKLTP